MAVAMIALTFYSASRAAAKDSEALCEGGAVTNTDGTFETAYWWQYGGVVSPDYGAFAERFEADGQLCQIGLQYTGIGVLEIGGPLDLYVWADESNIPGSVLDFRTNVFVGNVPVCTVIG